MRNQGEQKVDARWEAGEIGCGQLIVGLRRALDALHPEQRLQLVTHDGGAPIDIPAWCRMTGYKLLSANHPNYIIENPGEKNV